MAKQVGLIRLRGSVGDITYMDTKDGFRAQEKSRLSGDRIFTDKAFRRTRENCAEFGNAATSGKTFRDAFNDFLFNAKDRNLVTRTVKTLMVVLHSDLTERRGSRTVAAGDLSLLNGFEFNQLAVLTTMLFAPYDFTIDRASGTSSVTIHPLIPENTIVPPTGATHFQFMIGVSAIDFVKGTFTTEKQTGEILPINEIETGEIILSASIAANSTLPIFLVFGLCFHEQVNNFLYPLADGNFNPLSIVSVNLPK